MKELRWFTKDDGTRVLMFLEQTGPYSFRYVDIPRKYESLLAKHNETAMFKVKKEDIETCSLEIGDECCITMKHLPTGVTVKKDNIKVTFEEREELLNHLLNKIKQHHEKINS